MAPSFKYEKRLWKRGYRIVAGADEVGRGAWAGPVVSGAVAFAPMTNAKLQMTNVKEHLAFSIGHSALILIDDSKKLTPKERERAEKWIKKNALCWGLGQASPGEINRLGIAKASKMAFRRAVGECNRRLGSQLSVVSLQSSVISRQLTENRKSIPETRKLKTEFLLIDAFYLPYTRGIRRKNQLAIVNGDEKCFSIAAASILAKVYRDRLMRRLSRKYPRYKWAKNKGYGTGEHKDAIRKYGITRLHRRQFVKSIKY